MLRALLASIRAALRGGTRGFNPAETQLLSLVLEALPEDERRILRAQIDAISHVQRQHPGRLVVAFYAKSSQVEPLPYPGYEYCLARVTYRTSGTKRTTAVVLHDGRLMSLERNVPTAEEEIGLPVHVTLHPGRPSPMAAEIDREEHRDAR
jgi:hypothetical protein